MPPGLQDKQYENEVRHLMRLIHPNIVQLVGYCSETEKELLWYKGKYVSAEKSERLLCLEYMPKGSLPNHISGMTYKNSMFGVVYSFCFFKFLKVKLLSLVST
jgi:serine/threonine protein kinase